MTSSSICDQLKCYLLQGHLGQRVDCALLTARQKMKKHAKRCAVKGATIPAQYRKLSVVIASLNGVVTLSAKCVELQKMKIFVKGTKQIIHQQLSDAIILLHITGFLQCLQGSKYRYRKEGIIDEYIITD